MTIMQKKLQSYSAPGITVNFDPNLCYHSAICLKSLPAVFDVRRRRWIQPESAAIEEVIATVKKCPSGALTYQREGKPETVSEAPEDKPAVTMIQATLNGPLLVQGSFVLQDENGGIINTQERAALCRCGKTANQPFCDGNHVKAVFLSKKTPAA